MPDVKSVAETLKQKADDVLMEQIKREILESVKTEITKQIGTLVVANKVAETLKVTDDILVTTEGFPDISFDNTTSLREMYETLTRMPKSIVITFNDKGVPRVEFRGFFKPQETRNASNALLFGHRKHQQNVVAFLETICLKGK